MPTGKARKSGVAKASGQGMTKPRPVALKQKTLTGGVIESTQGSCPEELQQRALEIKKFADQEGAELFVCMCYPSRGSSDITAYGKLPGKLLQLVADKAVDTDTITDGQKGGYFEVWAVLSILAQDEFYRKMQKPCFPSHTLSALTGSNLCMMEMLYRQNTKYTSCSEATVKQNFIKVIECAIRYFDFIGAITLTHPVSVTISRLVHNWFHPDEISFYATIHILGTPDQVDKMQEKLYYRIDSESKSEHKYIAGEPENLQPITNSTLMQRLVQETELIHMQPGPTETLIVPWPQGIDLKLKKQHLVCLQPVNAGFK